LVLSNVSSFYFFVYCVFYVWLPVLAKINFLKHFSRWLNTREFVNLVVYTRTIMICYCCDLDL